jgi:hypothetical protein
LLLLRAKTITGGRITLRFVRFSHARPSDIEDHVALFQCPLHFGSAATELAFEAADLALPARKAAPALSAILDRHMQDLLDRLPHSDEFVQRVHRAFLAKIPNAPADAIDVNSVIASIFPLLQSIAGRSARVRTRLNDGLPKIAMDSNELVRVAMNLVASASESMRDVGEACSIEVSTSLVELQKTRRIWVASGALDIAGSGGPRSGNGYVYAFTCGRAVFHYEACQRNGAWSG